MREDDEAVDGHGAAGVRRCSSARAPSPRTHRSRQEWEGGLPRCACAATIGGSRNEGNAQRVLYRGGIRWHLKCLGVELLSLDQVLLVLWGAALITKRTTCGMSVVSWINLA
jgi:hypothetical protein